MTPHPLSRSAVVCCVLACAAWAAHAADPPPTPWLLGRAYKIPSEYTNQESGYFSIIEGHNGRLYIGAAKYGMDGYLLEFDPNAEAFRMVMDALKTKKGTMYVTTIAPFTLLSFKADELK